jgi:hypothetical protein
MWMATGCAPTPISIFAIDSNTGQPLANVQVQRWAKKTGTQSVGQTNTAGRLDGIAIKSGDRLTLTRAGYVPYRFETAALDVRPLKLVPKSESEKFPAGQVTADPNDEPFPYPADHVLTITLRPQ